jgi:hypothetical protein
MNLGISFSIVAFISVILVDPTSVRAVAPVCPDGTHAVAVPLPSPRPEYTPTPVEPVAPPAPKPDPGPVHPPKPKPVYIAPVPPAPVVEPADPPSLGIPILDDALAGKASAHLLPFWHHSPWQKIERPLTWTRWLYDELAREGDSLVGRTPKDAAIFCPNYKNLGTEEKRIFWMRLISAVMELESTYNPRISFHSERVEPGLFSVGLLMLSLPSSKQKRFQCSMIHGNDDLFDWRKNLKCGLKIMKYYYAEDGSFSGRTSASKEDSRWMGLARYWEPFRDQRLRQSNGAEAVLKKVKQRRRAWLKDAQSSIHPAYRDETFRKKGESPLERIARLMNTMPFCLTGAPDEFEVEVILPPPPVLPPSPAGEQPGDPAYLCMPDRS